MIIHANAQWQQTGPYGSTINCITINGNVIFAGTNYGVYSSTNNGINWVIVGLSNTPISALVNKGDTIIAGISNGNNYSNNYGVYISFNNWN